MDRTQQLVLPKLDQEKHRIGESFEDTSSITGGETSISGEGDHSSLVPGQHRPNETFVFLMRVMAPLGLKILDAPHFQVRIHMSYVILANQSDSNPLNFLFIFRLQI
jgi:hypothetical protein